MTTVVGRIQKLGIAVSIIGAPCMLFCEGAFAATKSLECRLNIPERSALQTMLVTLDDDSDKAEVVIKNDDTDCSKPNIMCAAEIYQKSVLPSVIRLTKSSYLSTLDISSSHTIDIDRTTLAVTSHLVMTGARNMDTTLSGSCLIQKVDAAKKLL